eukprot:CAMPEP_0177608084 /NCGR_PEP_ID=MMETSP0419_2-20121207/18272_1 /TAXON_ID=582737 /ORGANISM="Tetraselmis sp., Strain GSL018" /LENGTH=537 /DNA_ID=CAMNT_0019102729 /DNA_START=199 /DNA_END=1817 /DNA_ORIENTATION=-
MKMTTQNLQLQQDFTSKEKHFVAASVRQVQLFGWKSKLLFPGGMAISFSQQRLPNIGGGSEAQEGPALQDVAMGFESKTTPSKICKPSTPAPSNSTQSQSASQKHKAMIENIRDMELASAIVAIRAVAPLLGLWKGPSREPFYTKANAGALRGKGDPDPFDGDALKRLPAEQPRLAARSCAVVGNSGTLLSEMSAPDVDRHDFVLRINQGPTLPNYVAHTGEKTSARLVNRKFTQLYSLRPWLQSDPMGVAVIASRSSVRDFVALADSVMANHSGKAALFANSELVRDASAALVAFRTGFKLGLDIGMGGSGFIAPSTGFLAVQLASQICSNITVFGFSLAPPVSHDAREPDFPDLLPKDPLDSVVTFRRSSPCKLTPPPNLCPKDVQKRRLQGSPLPLLRRQAAWPSRPTRAFSAKPDKFILEGWFLKALHILGLVCIEPQPSFLGPCGSRLDGLVDRFGKPTRAWPSLEEIINDDALAEFYHKARQGSEHAFGCTSPQVDGSPHPSEPAHTYAPVDSHVNEPVMGPNCWSLIRHS